MYHIRASLPKILAHAMAHEIGHVLLRSDDHSEAGIMSGRWTTADWQTVAASHMSFLPWQMERMRCRLSILNQPRAVGERIDDVPVARYSQPDRHRYTVAQRYLCGVEVR